MGSNREALRQTFEAVASRYQHARPEYPDALFDALAQHAKLRPDDHLLEIGCATGKATQPLARRGYRITCIELGERLAAAARSNLSDQPKVEVIEGAFEKFQPASRTASMQSLQPLPGTGSTRSFATPEPTSCSDAAATSRSGARPMSSPKAATRSSASSSRSTMKSERGFQPAPRGLARASFRIS